MQIHLKFFASLREAVGTGSESVSLPSDVTTAGQVRDFLRARGGAYAQALAEGRPVRVAINQVMARADTPLSEGAEVGLFPPVTGG